MGEEMEAQKAELSTSDAALIAILRESAEAAADRIIAQQAREAATPERHLLLPGHVYLIIGCVTLLALTVAGALSR